MSKHALLAVSHAAKFAGWQDGVRVTALCPGAIDTELIAGLPGATPAANRLDPATVAEAVALLLRLPDSATVAETRDEHAAGGEPLMRASAVPDQEGTEVHLGLPAQHQIADGAGDDRPRGEAHPREEAQEEPRVRGASPSSGFQSAVPLTMAAQVLRIATLARPGTTLTATCMLPTSEVMSATGRPAPSSRASQPPPISNCPAPFCFTESLSPAA